MHKLGPDLLVKVHDDFGIGFRGESMPTLSKLVAKLHIVIDLSVKYYRHRAVFVEDRLVSTDHVDDGEALDRKPGPRLDMDSARIRATVFHHFTHSMQ
jgi:hypothetical protein